MFSAANPRIQLLIMTESKEDIVNPEGAKGFYSIETA
jgi:hypothetical protein